MKSNSLVSWTRQFCGALRLGIGVVLAVSVSASTADAGVIPWLVDSLFGPSHGPYQASYGASYGRYATGYGGYGCPPSGYTSVAPQRAYTQPVAAAPYYGSPYGRPCGVPCLPRIPNPLGLLGGLFGCSPCGSSFGRGYAAPWGCSPCGYGGCPITLPGGSASTGAASGGWQKAAPAARTFVDGPQAAGDRGIDTRALRPPSDPDADPGEVIPKFVKPSTKAADDKKPAEAKKPAEVKKPAEEKKPAEVKKPAEKKKPATDKSPTALDSAAIGPVVHHVVPSRARLARRGSSRQAAGLPSIVVSRSVINVRPSLRSELPGSTIAGR